MKIKKTVALLLCAALLFSAFGGSASAALLGDVNGDGKVGPEDARAILRASAKLDPADGATAALMDTNGEPAVTVDYKTPVIAFWSPYGKQAPFVCIEPWYGLGDPRDFKGEFKDKPLMNHLLPGASFMSRYTITIG